MSSISWVNLLTFFLPEIDLTRPKLHSYPRVNENKEEYYPIHLEALEKLVHDGTYHHRLSCCSNNNICFTNDGLRISSAWVNNGHCCIFFHEQQWHRQPNYITTTHYSSFLPLYGYPTSRQQFKTSLPRKEHPHKTISMVLKKINLWKWEQFHHERYLWEEDDRNMGNSCDTLGVQGRNSGCLPFIASLPMFRGWNPSTSFWMLISLSTFSSLICLGKGSWTSIPVIQWIHSCSIN